MDLKDKALARYISFRVMVYRSPLVANVRSAESMIPSDNNMSPLLSRNTECESAR